MRNYFYHIFGLLVILNFCLPQAAISKEYTIPVIRVEVSVNSDGSIRITEYRTYRYDGDFSWANYPLPFGNSAGYTTIKDIRVSENGTPFINQNDEEPGTFLVDQSDDEIEIKWFYEAEDEERTFAISYTLEGAIVIGSEWAEFFWTYVGSTREKDTDSLRINLQLPTSVATDSLYTWERGPRNAVTFSNTPRGYSVLATDIDDDESVKIRAVFPRSVFDENAVSTNDSNFSLADAQANEETFRKNQIIQEKRDARYANYGKTLAVIISVLSIVGFVFLYQKYGKRHKARGSHVTETVMVPGRLKPAVAGWLIHGRNISSLHLMATLLDLARKKHFIIKEEKPEKKWVTGDKKVFTIEKGTNALSDDLTEWEKSLAHFVYKQIENENNRIDKLFAESSFAASKWFSKWKKEVNTFCKAKDWYDENSYTGVYINVGLQLFLTAFAILSAFWLGPLGAIPIALTAILLICSFAIIRRTAKGEKNYARWKAYYEGLKNAKEHSIGSDLLDRHLIYAVAFGLTKKNIETVFEQSDAINIAFYWFVFQPGSSSSPADIAGTFSTLSATGTASFPGASAAGGTAGASAGVAGGGAGGGAG